MHFYLSAAKLTMECATASSTITNGWYGSKRSTKHKTTVGTFQIK